MVLADKGYHTGAQLLQCQQENIITHVAYKEQPSVKHIANEFLAESFAYDKLTDTYTCPASAIWGSLPYKAMHFFIWVCSFFTVRVLHSQAIIANVRKLFNAGYVFFQVAIWMDKR